MLSQTPCIAKDDFEPLPPPPGCWDYRCGLCGDSDLGQVFVLALYQMNYILSPSVPLNSFLPLVLLLVGFKITVPIIVLQLCI